MNQPPKDRTPAWVGSLDFDSRQTNWWVQCGHCNEWAALWTWTEYPKGGSHPDKNLPNKCPNCGEK